MGLDFIRRASKGFTKAWDRGRVSLAQPTLFTRHPESRRRTVIAELSPGCRVSVGMELMVCVDGERLILLEEISEVGCVECPPADSVDAIRTTGGHALGHVVCINPISGTADVEIE